ncbi:MAG TPA: hypothetical protein VD947_01450 [Patescibacteria group bacterium]|nr:hypothetical protein [Patescibacteria group bacterium]
MSKESILGYYIYGENGDQVVTKSSRKALSSIINSVGVSMHVEVEAVELEESEVPETLKGRKPEQVKLLVARGETSEKAVEEFRSLAFESWQPVKGVLLRHGYLPQEIDDFIPPELPEA